MWDHPDKRQTYCTFAHNLVVIDGRDQQRRGRGGSFHLFSATSSVKVAEASSHAYGPESLYRRTCALVDHGPSGSYVVDVFRAGGGTRRDYVFHGPGDPYETDRLALASVPSDPSAEGALPLENVRRAAGDSAWSIRWPMQGGYELRALAPGQPGEIVFVGDGWGQRDHRNTDRGATLPYVVRRRESENGRDAFVAVFAAGPADERLVEGVRLLPLRGGESPEAIAVAVDTTDGTDLVVSQLEPKRVAVSFDDGDLTTDGRLTAIVSRGGKPARACLVEGSHLAAPAVTLDPPVAAYRGNIVDVASVPGTSYFVVDGDLPHDADLAGQTLFAIDGDTRRAYPIAAVETVDGQLRVVTKRGGRGFEARPAARWELPVTAEKQISE